MAFTPRSAKNAKVRLGAGVVLTAKSWTVTPESDEIDVTNFESAGCYECIGGIQKCTFQIELDFSGAVNESPYDIVSNGIQPGKVYTGGIKLYLNDTTGPFWSLPTAFIKSIPNTANVKEAVKGTISGTASGALWLYPNGAF